MAEYVRAGKNFPRGYDNYLLEGGRTLVAAATFGLLSKDANIILLNADETFINVVDGVPHYEIGESIVHRLCSKQLDGLIDVGEFVGEYAQRAGVSVPSRTVYPSISADLFEDLREVGPAIGSKNIVSVAVGKPSVGFDILVEAFEEVKRTHPTAELHIAGRDHPEEWNERPGVTVHGWVEDLPEFFARGELSVHPGRSECFPVSTLEPLCAGIPCVVSEMVGTKEVIKEIDGELITQVDSDSVRDAIDRYLSENEEYRRRVTAECREQSDRFTEAACADVFERQFWDLVSELSA
jgi:glycosyltransferase involved in cell wall biosynthesis